jgi:hypothetical protein
MRRWPISTILHQRGMYVRRLAWNGVESLVATTRRTKKPTVYLMGHIDVVPAPEYLFRLEERDGKYYARWFMPHGTQCAIAYPRGGGHHGSEEWIGVETLKL